MTHFAYYNEIDPYCAQWLRNLIDAKLIAPGDVDERDIKLVRPEDITGYVQAHFFAGIGGWSYALRCAGWPDNRPVWTGSCPCQPFSAAGKRKGFADERHLWPLWFSLIAKCHPPVVFGEQVVRAKLWIDQVRADLESKDYACAVAVLPAAGVGAPHRRDRFWFVAHTFGAELRNECGGSSGANGQSTSVTGAHGATQPLAYADSPRWPQRGQPHLLAQCTPSIGNSWWIVEPAVGRVANGVPARVAKLRAFGNAIVPQVAAEFIGAYMDYRP